jgi:hypothetical protein
MSILKDKVTTKIEINEYGNLGVWTLTQVYRDDEPIGEPHRHFHHVRRHNWALATELGEQVSQLASLLWTKKQAAVWDKEEAEALGVSVEVLLKPVASQL